MYISRWGVECCPGLKLAVLDMVSLIEEVYALER